MNSVVQPDGQACAGKCQRVEEHAIIPEQRAALGAAVETITQNDHLALRRRERRRTGRGW